MWDFISNNCEYILPIMFLIYSIIIWIKGNDELATNVKRIYYSMVVLCYIILVNTVDVSRWCDKGQFGISNIVWSYCVSIIITVVLAVLIDNFIISGFVFKELGFFGTKFIREETKKAVDVQYKYLLNLEGSLETLHKIPNKIQSIFSKPDVIKSIKEGSFDFVKEFTFLLQYYYSLKKIDADIDVLIYKCEKKDIDNIVSEYIFLYLFQLELSYIQEIEKYKVA